MVWRDDPPRLDHIAGTVLPYAYGRSYGDSCLNASGTLVDMRSMNRIIGFDPHSGVIEVEAGVLLSDIIAYAASHEGALHLEDVLTRRTRISIETAHRGVDSAEHAARLMGTVLGWDERTRAHEVEYYTARVAAERESQRMPDDLTADAARFSATR